MASSLAISGTYPPTGVLSFRLRTVPSSDLSLTLGEGSPKMLVFFLKTTILLKPEVSATALPKRIAQKA